MFFHKVGVSFQHTYVKVDKNLKRNSLVSNKKSEPFNKKRNGNC